MLCTRLGGGDRCPADKFCEMHDRLYENQNALDDESLIAYAEGIGLDVEKFTQHLRSDSSRKKCAATMVWYCQVREVRFRILKHRLIGKSLNDQPYYVCARCIEQEDTRNEIQYLVAAFAGVQSKIAVAGLWARFNQSDFKNTGDKDE